jgi:translation initiation factor 3 subunit B
MHWQPNGDYLLAKVTRKKGKKPLPTLIFIFRLRQKDFPIEELEVAESVSAVAWEPKGTRFAVAHGDNPSGRSNISFFNLAKAAKKLEPYRVLDGRPCNAMFWSPAGSHVLCAGLGGTLAGALEFVDATSGQIVATHDHFQCTDVEWSPCGRYVVTAATQPLHAGGNVKATIDNGYKLWTVQGKQLTNRPVEELFQFAWRPRPPSLLSAQQKVRSPPHH